MKRPKQNIKTVLLELSIYDVVSFEELQKLKNSYKAKFEKFIIESTPYNCGCWDNCICPREKLAFKGVRLETEVEYQTRLEKELAEEKERNSLREQQERKLLIDLKKKYPDEESTNA